MAEKSKNTEDSWNQPEKLQDRIDAFLAKRAAVLIDIDSGS